MSAAHLPPLPEPTTVDLAKQALGDARELVQLEVRLARAELLEELASVKRAAVAGLLGFAFVLLAFSALVMALVLALGGTAGAALAVAAGFLVLGAALGAFAYAALPRSILDRSRRHLKRDISELKEHAA
jgi:uncharacterized membrane protein YqjE